MPECRHCGAAVADESRHRRWHDAIASDVQKMQRTIQRLESDVRALQH